ncbi:MAG: hypothetical protein ACK4NY_02585 [Spirosomataceae bacterium]
MKALLKNLGLEGILRINNKTLGWIEPAERRRGFGLTNEEIMKDLTFGVR